jgi:hypothetical protein
MDCRLLKNVDSLKAVARHEIAEVTAILAFEEKFMDPRTLQDLLEAADDLGYGAE